MKRKAGHYLASTQDCHIQTNIHTVEKQMRDPFASGIQSTGQIFTSKGNSNKSNEARVMKK